MAIRLAAYKFLLVWQTMQSLEGHHDLPLAAQKSLCCVEQVGQRTTVLLCAADADHLTNITPEKMLIVQAQNSKLQQQ